MSKVVIAEYKCLGCEAEFSETPNSSTKCPKCGHLYVKWVNFDELRKQGLVPKS